MIYELYIFNNFTKYNGKWLQIFKSRTKKNKIYLFSHTDIAVSIIYLKVHTMDFIGYYENV